MHCAALDRALGDARRRVRLTTALKATAVKKADTTCRSSFQRRGHRSACTDLGLAG